ncbi:MAG: hypothetical protein ACTHU0_05600 [Kofleriaceae bacterium]
MTHLDHIAARQTRSRVRDALFVVAVALATMISVSSIGTAAAAAAPHATTQR